MGIPLGSAARMIISVRYLHQNYFHLPVSGVHSNLQSADKTRWGSPNACFTVQLNDPARLTWGNRQTLHLHNYS